VARKTVDMPTLWISGCRDCRIGVQRPISQRGDECIQFDVPSFAATRACARLQWGSAPPTAFSPACVSETSRVRASRPGAMATKPRSTSGSRLRDSAVRSSRSTPASSDMREVPWRASVRSSENCVTRNPDGAIRSS
jgi:hypothetical protein